MSDARWRRVQDLYHGALERPALLRAEFLSEECAGDAGLRHEVQSLLDQPISADQFLVAGQSSLGDTSSGRIGQLLGVYQVKAFIGRGGMGEVYRARDTKLTRDVAIKVLPSDVASDPDRLSRFQREARVLASLNHPHIGAIYGLEDVDGVRALVLELVEGDTVADRISRGPIPLTETLAIARQIADALDAAHKKGIIHRDLKPSNIKVTPDGVVKVLDFGLAKATAGDGAASDLAQSPTITVGGTRQGVVLGTAAYMSPEQARGKHVDKRADIWSFGCVLFEMLTGKRPFGGETIHDTLAAVIERQPDWATLPAGTPLAVRRLLQQCLQKDPDRRLRDIGDATVQLEARRRSHRTIAVAAAAVVLFALVATGWRLWPSGRLGAGPQIRSLAVLPFKSLRENPAENYIGLGVADSVIMGISRARTLTVRPTSAVRAYATGSTDALTAARELGVDAVLDGTWYREGERLRVAVNLLRVLDGVSMWTDSLDMRSGDMFAIQDQLAGQIASRLRVELVQMRTGSARRGTESAEAYDLYLKGRFYFGQRGIFTEEQRANSDTATTYFEHAVRIDPAFADAHAMLGFAYAWKAVFVEENLSLIERAEAETAHAEQLNPGLGQIHLTRGFILFSWYRGWRLTDAIRENRLAIDLDPGLSDNELGGLFLHVGLYDESEKANQRAIDLDPTNQRMKFNFVTDFIATNRPEDALATQQRLLPDEHFWDFWYFLSTRRLREAEPLIEKKMADTPNDVATLEALALLRALKGRHAEAEALVPRILYVAKRNRHYHHQTYTIARIYALGRKAEDAARWLKETIDHGFPCYPMMRDDTFLDPVRNAPEIQALLVRLRSQFEDFRAMVAAPLPTP